jgi:2-polyprenyl-3-methyl-5-hydroxy-6-metoxy-1,4-benzoquinol methylase
MSQLMSTGNRAGIYDYVDLLLLHLAKIQRTKIQNARGAEEFYEEFFTEIDEHSFGSDGDPRRRNRAIVLRRAVSESTPAGGGRLLDVGCGTGDNLRYVMDPRLELHGIEYAESTSRMARRLLGDKATIQRASATAIPYPDQHFDLIMCIEVLEHIEDDSAAMKEIARVLRPGGKMVLSLPYRHWFPSYFRLIGHFRHYTRKDVEKLLSVQGFRVVRCLENYPRWSIWANYCYMTARAYSIAQSLFGRRVAATDIRAPFSRRKLLEVLFERLEGMRKLEADIDYSKLDTSTFVLAEKALAAN